ncbi:tRNA-dihydrouridine synthase family protein [Nannocystis sp.]|uniref:tRNA dihydrouridine synthase n=1 Tax=Nannocystis sp. TaxID=1962667 RepID=UPI0025D110F0|nr:tRNA-dihydrouridine synthase family protein [Nannocystis sp.]MBK7825362.1 tRNA-dihydrouridine synthase family protein [Nannocystis sp.]
MTRAAECDAASEGVEGQRRDAASAAAARWRAVWATRATVATRPDEAGLYLALAPMDGVTDAVYRELMTGLYDGRSGISVCVSEFVRVTRDAVPAAVLRREVPELERGGRTAAGVPVFVQLLGGDPEPVAQTARTAASLGALGVDLNFGCPAKTVNNHDGGATLLKYPRRIEAIVGRARALVPAHVPVTMKMRVGWDSCAGIEEVARAAEAGGAAWITVHARTRAQLYQPPVVWHALALARAAVKVPVVANGDLRELGDLAACAAQSECEAFMIGRGAMARPELFAQIRGQVDERMSEAALAELLIRYHAMLLASGVVASRALARVKQWLRMAADMDAGLAPLFDAIKVLPAWELVAPALSRGCRGSC